MQEKRRRGESGSGLQEAKTGSTEENGRFAVQMVKSVFVLQLGAGTTSLTLTSGFNVLITTALR